MALINKISYKVSGNYYKPKTVPKPKAQQPPPKIWNPMALPQAQAPIPQAAPKYWNPSPYNVQAAQAPVPAAPSKVWNPMPYNVQSMQGTPPLRKEQGVGFKPSKLQQLSIYMDRLFGSNAKSSLGAASKTAIPIQAYNMAPNNLPVPIAPAPAPRYAGWNPSPYNVQQAQQPRPAAPYAGWNPSPYNVPKSTPPVPDAILASPWQSRNVGRLPGQPTAAEQNVQRLQERKAATGTYNPYGGTLDAQLAPAYNSQRYNYENVGSPQAVAPQTGAVEDRFSRGNFLPSQRTMTLYDMPGVNTPQGYFTRFNAGNEAFSVPNRMLNFASDYPWEVQGNNWFEPPSAWKDTTQQWKESFDQGWQVNPMVDNTAYEPYVEGGAGGWGYGGGWGGGGGGSSHYNSNPNYIGGNRGYAQTHRQSMLLWNI